MTQLTKYVKNIALRNKLGAIFFKSTDVMRSRSNRFMNIAVRSLLVSIYQHFTDLNVLSYIPKLFKEFLERCSNDWIDHSGTNTTHLSESDLKHVENLESYFRVHMLTFYMKSLIIYGKCEDINSLSDSAMTDIEYELNLHRFKFSTSSPLFLEFLKLSCALEILL